MPTSSELKSGFIIVIFFISLQEFDCTRVNFYSTNDSVVSEGNYPPRLPGPSIFEYRGPYSQPHPPIQETSASNTKVEVDSAKVKRGNENGTETKENGTTEPSRYYELAGDELYVFEPSPMGVAPFLEEFTPHHNHPHKSHFTRERGHKPKNPNFFKHHTPHSTNEVGSSYLFDSRPNRPPFQFNFGDVKIEQVTPKDAIYPQNYEEIEQSSDSSGDDSLVQGEGECISANEKEGQCVPFRSCYPVVFNSVDGQLKNHELAKMLYQASGPCSKNESWTVHTVSVQVQPGKTSHVPLEIPPDFFNYTVCCPGYFYFENTIPHQYEIYKKPLRLKLRPSHPDLMLSPPQEGRTISHGPHPPFHHNNYYTRVEFPPPLLLHHGDMFDSEVELTQDEGEGGDYYENEGDFESLRYASTTTTIKPRQKIREKNSQKNSQKHSQKNPQKNATNVEVKSPRNSTEKGHQGQSQNQGRAESSLSEVKIGAASNNSTSKAKGKARTTLGKKNNTENHNYNKLLPPNNPPLPTPVVISPPHLSAWNCPGRGVTMPRGHWPWLVALLNEGSHFCSGSLIDHKHILTSASCVASYQGKEIGKMRAILGDRILYSSIDGPHVWRKIVRITRHLQYNSDTMEHDIAILEMDNAVAYTANIQPINLPSSGNKGHTEKAIVSGWSGADLGKRFFSPRQTVDVIVEFMERKECGKKYEGFKSDRGLDDVICTKASEMSCKADLGTPLMMKTGNCWHIIGILSHGLGCGMFPDIFTDTAKHLEWIQKNMRPQFPSHDTFLKS